MIELRKSVFLFLILFLTGCSSTFDIADGTLQDDEPNSNLKAMIIIGDEFGNTYFNMKDKLEENGFEVITVGVGSKTLMSSCPNHESIEVEVDIEIEDITEDNITEFYTLFIPAGKHFRSLPFYSDVGRVLKLAKENSVIISSICSGNIVLAKVEGLIEGTEIATSSVTKDEIVNAGGIVKYSSVVVDENFITGSTSNGNNDNAPVEEMVQSILDVINNQDTKNSQ